MAIKPILSALRKHRLATVLIALEIALACAVLCNATFLIAHRVSQMQVISGVDEASLATVQLTGYDASQAVDLNARVLAALRGIPGVQSASVLGSIPFGMGQGRAGIFSDAAKQNFGGVVDFYIGGPGSFEALGVHLVAGRAPQADDYQPIASFLPQQASVQITRVLAEHLWPGANPLGQEVWAGGHPFRVVGVLDHLIIPAPGGGEEKDPDWSVFVPAQPGPQLSGSYLLRAEPTQLQRVLRDALAAVTKVAPDAVVDRENSQTVSVLRHKYFENDRAMAGLLVGVIAALLLVTALGIVGLVSFWVAQRRKQIGVRRALGATRSDILRYFQTENFLIVSFGIALGMVMAFGLNLLLMQYYELPRLPLVYLPVGALALWVLGQLAVLAPALRASRVPPVVATRSV